MHGIDYLTVTTYERKDDLNILLFAYASAISGTPVYDKRLKKFRDIDDRTLNRVSQQRGEYSGYAIEPETGGGIFVGERLRDGNVMMQLSGAIPQLLLKQLTNLVNDSRVNVTRIDLQVTLSYPSGHEQIRLYNRLYKRGSGKVAMFGSSSAGEGDTVYYGDRKSSTYFVRVYEKSGDLRVEVEIKRDAAKAYAVSILSSDVRKTGDNAISGLKLALRKSGLGDEKIRSYVDDYRATDELTRVVVNNDNEGREKWLDTVVVDAVIREFDSGNIGFIEKIRKIVDNYQESL